MPLYYSLNGSSLHQELLNLRTKYNQLSAKKAAASLMMLRQNYYDQGEKAGKLLAWRFKQKHSIEYNSGSITVDPVKINDTFLRLYILPSMQILTHKQPFLTVYLYLLSLKRQKYL